MENNQQDILKIQKWNAVSKWEYANLNNTICGICRNELPDPCINCNSMGIDNNEKCDVATGACNHQFHFHCISRWLKNKNVCPLDFRDWEFVKYSS